MFVTTNHHLELYDIDKYNKFKDEILDLWTHMLGNKLLFIDGSNMLARKIEELQDHELNKYYKDLCMKDRAIDVGKSYSRSDELFEYTLKEEKPDASFLSPDNSEIDEYERESPSKIINIKDGVSRRNFFTKSSDTQYNKKYKLDENKYEHEIIVPIVKYARRIFIIDRHFLGDRNYTSHNLDLLFRIISSHSKQLPDIILYVKMTRWDIDKKKKFSDDIKGMEAKYLNLKGKIKPRYLFDPNNTYEHGRYIITNQIGIKFDKGIVNFFEDGPKSGSSSINYVENFGKILSSMKRIQQFNFNEDRLR